MHFSSIINDQLKEYMHTETIAWLYKLVFPTV